MDRLLQDIVDDVLDAYEAGRVPAPGLGQIYEVGEEMSPILLFHKTLLASDLENTFSEQDLIEAHMELGLDYNDAIDALQRLASWW
jgi:hypothetical protein